MRAGPGVQGEVRCREDLCDGRHGRTSVVAVPITIAAHPGEGHALGVDVGASAAQHADGEGQHMQELNGDAEPQQSRRDLADNGLELGEEREESSAVLKDVPELDRLGRLSAATTTGGGCGADRAECLCSYRARWRLVWWWLWLGRVVP